jgi:two-component system cell cycle response regulator DivK
MKTNRGRLRVLIVDDFTDARDMYREYFQFAGFDVVEAANGVEALRHAREAAPHIILMDLSLPVLDGWEATRRLKADDQTADIPVIALTSHALTGTFERASEAGCDSILTKPCLPADVVNEVHKLMKAGSRSTTRKKAKSAHRAR